MPSLLPNVGRLRRHGEFRGSFRYRSGQVEADRGTTRRMTIREMVPTTRESGCRVSSFQGWPARFSFLHS